MNGNPPPFQPGALEMSMISIGALLGVVSLILFIMIVVKMFQRNETAIGIVTIVTLCIGGIGHLVALVYGWMKAGEWNIRGLMMTYTFTLLGSMIIGGIGYGIFISKMVNEIQNNPQLQQQMEQMQREMEGLENGLEIEVVSRLSRNSPWFGCYFVANREANEMSQLRWGILSTAKIGTEKVIPAMQRGERCEVVGICSRSIDRAEEVASQLAIPKSYGSYEELLEDAQIDAVYNPLPNHMHIDWSIKCLEAGKHVLCEKPIGLSSAEGQRLVDAAANFPDLKVMEAFMYRHHPQWQKAKSIIDGGGVGEFRTIQSFFSYFNDDGNNIRNQKDIGGGALMDIGCYNISLSRFLFGEEPKRVLGLIEHDPNFGTDRISSGVMEFTSGTSTFTCGTQLVPYQRMNAFGTTGRVEIEIPFNAPPDQPCKMWHQQGSDIEEMTFDICDQYTIQGDLFAEAVLDDKPVPTPLLDAVQNMKVIEAIVESAAANGWVEI